MMKDRIELKKYYSTKEFLENYIYEENNLGVECTEEGTTFRLWSPQAECISLNLYQRRCIRADSDEKRRKGCVELGEQRRTSRRLL
jgi:1,4-alpha-glucan branching enzyme